MKYPLLDSNPLPALICDRETLSINYVNQAVVRFLGIAAADWPNRHLFDCIDLPTFSLGILEYDVELLPVHGIRTPFRVCMSEMEFEDKACLFLVMYPRSVECDAAGLLDNTPEALAVLTESGLVLFANPALLQILEVGLDEVAGKDFFETVFRIIGSSVSSEGAVEDPLAIVHARNDYSGVLRIQLPKSGLVRYASLDLKRFLDGRNRKRIAVTVNDVTAKFETDFDLEEKKQRLSLATSCTGMGIWEWRLFEDRLYWDENVRKLFGVEPDRELFFNDIARFLHPDDSPGFIDQLTICLQQPGQHKGTFRIIRQTDGQIRHIEVHGAFFHDSQGTPLKMVGVVWDVTHQKEAEAELKDLSDRLTLATRAANVGIWEYDVASRKLYWDSAALEIYGLTGSEMSTYDEWQLRLHPEDRNVINAGFFAAVETENSYSGEFRIKRADGEERYVKTLGLVERNAANLPIRVVGVNWDITEQKLADDKLRASEARYRSIVEDQPAMVFRVDKDFCLTFSNNSFNRTFGHNSDQLGLLSAVLPDRHQSVLRQFLESVFESRTNDRLEMLLDSTRKLQWIEWTAIPIQDRFGHITEIQVIGDDITDRKKLEHQQKRLDRIVRESYNEIYLFNDTTFTFEYANDSALKNLGYSQEELYLMKLTDLFHYPNEMALQILLDTLRTNETDRLRLQMRHCRKDGTYYDLDTLIQYAGDDNAFVAIATDITGKLQTEKKLLATVREKELLVKEIHHRVKNNLQLISSIMYIKQSSVADSGTKHFISELREKIHAMALIHERLLQSENLNQVEMSDYLGKLISGLKNSTCQEEKSIEISARIDKVVLDIDSAIYCALLVNELVTNAVKHAFRSMDRGKIDVGLRYKEGIFTLIVSDNGLTMPEEFGPGRSNSFGMSLVDILGKQVGGTLQVRREQGTTFEITFKEKK